MSTSFKFHDKNAALDLLKTLHCELRVFEHTHLPYARCLSEASIAYIYDEVSFHQYFK